MLKPTRQLLAVAIALLVFGLLGAPATGRAAAPDTPLKVLVFWGSWCSNCPAVMREMEVLRKQYIGRNVEFVAVSLEGETAPQQYLSSKGYGFALKTNGDALLARYQAVGVPWVVLTDNTGKAVANPSRGGAADDLAGLVKLELDLRT